MWLQATPRKLSKRTLYKRLIFVWERSSASLSMQRQMSEQCPDVALLSSFTVHMSYLGYLLKQLTMLYSKHCIIGELISRAVLLTSNT